MESQTVSFSGLLIIGIGYQVGKFTGNIAGILSVLWWQ